LIAGTKGEKAGKAAIGAISTRSERLVTGYLERTQRRPSGTLVAITGGTEGLALVAKSVARWSARTLSTEPMRQPTRWPSRNVDEARLRGRRKLS
jgi:hypothetical protein